MLFRNNLFSKWYNGPKLFSRIDGFLADDDGDNNGNNDDDDGDDYLEVPPVDLLTLPDLLLDQLKLPDHISVKKWKAGSRQAAIPGQHSLLPGSQLGVKLQAAGALQPLQVERTSPSDTHTVQDEGAGDVSLEGLTLVC